MTEMERDIYDRAAVHYIKKHDCLILNNAKPPEIIQEFWKDWFDGKPIYNTGSLSDEQRTLLGVHGPQIA